MDIKKEIRRFLVRKALFRMSVENPEKFEKILLLAQPRIKTFSDVEVEMDFFFYPLNPTEQDILEMELYFGNCFGIYSKRLDMVIKMIKDANSEFDSAITEWRGGDQ